MFSRSSSRTSSVTLSRTLSMRRGTLCFVCWSSVVYLTPCPVRKTVTALDVVYALKRSGRTLYGFGA